MQRYDNLDGLRSFSCIAIIAMHIAANANYQIDSWLFTDVIRLWGHLVALFLMISGFGMFCGYYEKFRSGSVDLNIFYSKRYSKILPFFISLIIIDILMDRSFSHIIEGITEATMVFGLLPNNQPSVIGVSWTLGVIFLFYMLFPFTVYLCWNKKRAIISFILSIVISIFCSAYYFTESFVIEGFVARHNILYCAPWILGGGIVYLYRNEIKSFVTRFRWAFLAGCITLDVIWHFVPEEIAQVDTWMLKNLFLYLPFLMYAISVDSKVLSNKVMRYFSGISLELYLAQMVIYRVVEKANCLYLFGNGWISFIATCAIVLILLILFIEIWKRLYNYISHTITNKISSKQI